MSYKIAGQDPGSPQQDLMKVDVNSEFARTILTLFQQIRPRKLIETGTFLGMGTTAITGQALRQCGITDAQFYSIEVNPQFQAMARQNLASLGLSVNLLLGLSVPRPLLPPPEQIRKEVVEHQVDGIYVDHPEAVRAQNYYAETNFPGLEDDLLGKVLAHFQYQPDFVLLDSAGHLGHVEFVYTVSKLRGRCFLALDDTNHVKHFQSVLDMKQDKRFRIAAESKEKFGFCIAEFNP